MSARTGRLSYFRTGAREWAVQLEAARSVFDASFETHSKIEAFSDRIAPKSCTLEEHTAPLR